MYNFPSMHCIYISITSSQERFWLPLGASDQSRLIDVDVWTYAMQNESVIPPPFYPEEFEIWAARVLGRESSTIHASEVRDLYLILSQQQPPTSIFEIISTTDDDETSENDLSDF